MPHREADDGPLSPPRLHDEPGPATRPFGRSAVGWTRGGDRVGTAVRMGETWRHRRCGCCGDRPGPTATATPRVGASRSSGRGISAAASAEGRAALHPAAVTACASAITSALPCLAISTRAVCPSNSGCSRCIHRDRLRTRANCLRLAASLTDAAHAAGFSDSSHANRAFHEMFGIAPTTARRTVRLQ